MDYFDGTAARQLDLADDRNRPFAPRRKRINIRLLKRDVYQELERRRRRAQIAARHLLDRDGD